MEWKINWKRKLTSRKFWLAVAGFVGPLMLAFGASEAVASQVTALIMAGAAVVAYIIGEGLADGGNQCETQGRESGQDDIFNA